LKDPAPSKATLQRLSRPVATAGGKDVITEAGRFKGNKKKDGGAGESKKGKGDAEKKTTQGRW